MGSAAIGHNSSRRGFGLQMVMPGSVPKIAGWRPISLVRWPLAKMALCRFAFSFVKQEVELTFGGVGIHLFVPPPLFARAKPLDDAPVFFRRKTIDSSLDLLDPPHA